jgi:hypothetical protein
VGREYGGEHTGLTAERIVSLTVEGRGGQPIHIRMDLPTSAGGVRMPRPTMRVFTGIAADTDVTAFATADGAAWLTIVHGPNAPARFRYVITLPEGLALEPMSSGGLDFMHPHYGATVGRLYRPWASDAMFRPLAAEYLAQEPAVLTVNVESASATYPFVVGVVYGSAPRPA